MAQSQQSLNVSYITNAHSVSLGTTVGSIIVNYLIKTNTHPTANVVIHTDDCEVGSLYNYPLTDPVGNHVGSNSVRISRSQFVNDREKLYSLKALQDYLMRIRNKYYEGQHLLDETNKAIKEMLPAPPAVVREEFFEVDEIIPRESTYQHVPLGGVSEVREEFIRETAEPIYRRPPMRQTQLIPQAQLVPQPQLIPQTQLPGFPSQTRLPGFPSQTRRFNGQRS